MTTPDTYCPGCDTFGDLFSCGRTLDQADLNYAAAQADPIAQVVLTAMGAQDAATYNGSRFDRGAYALRAAEQIRRLR